MKIGAKISALFGLAMMAMVVIGAYSPPSYVVEDIGGLGGVGDGVTVQNPVFSVAAAAVASGGKIRLPCGIFKLTSAFVINVAAGAHVDLEGSGADCTVIYVSGAIDGPRFNFGSQWSSVRVANLTVETDQVGGTKCLVWSGSFTNPNSAYAAASAVENVTLRGTDLTTTNANYCGVGFYEFSISNISVNNYSFNGTPSHSGTAISVNGSGTGGTYSVVMNVSNSNITECGTGMYYGDWVQGITFSATNITGCNYGINTVTTPSGVLDEIALVNSQVNAFVCGICVQDASFDDVIVSNSILILNANATGVKLQGTNFIIEGDQISSTSTTGTIGIDATSIYGNGGIVAGNAFLGFAKGIQTETSTQAPLRLTQNQFGLNTADYSINSASLGVVVNDDQPRNVASVLSNLPCNSAIKYSKVEVVDSPTVTYNATVTVGAGSNFVSLKCDGARYYVD